MNKKVLTKWGVDGDLAVIYQVENLLFFYSKGKDPEFKKGEEISLERAEKTMPYKVIPFSMDNVPNDAYMSATFAWQ